MLVSRKRKRYIKSVFWYQYDSTNEVGLIRRLEAKVYRREKEHFLDDQESSVVLHHAVFFFRSGAYYRPI